MKKHKSFDEHKMEPETETQSSVVLPHVALSIVIDQDAYKLVEVAYDLSLGAIGSMTVLSSHKDKEEAFEAFKIRTVHLFL